MSVVRIYQYFVLDRPGSLPVQGGSLSESRSITLDDDEVIDRNFNIATETAVKVFDASEDEALGGFDFGWLETDLDVLVQYTTDAGVTDAYDVKTLKGSGVAGQMGPAMVLGSDATQLLDGSIDTFDGTAGTIDEIWVYNESTTDAARVRIAVAK